MAIQNRFYKTTQGVPYEFALVLPNTSSVSVIDDAHSTGLWSTVAGTAAAVGDFYLLRQNPTTGVIHAARNNGGSAAIFRTGIYKDWPHQLAWCINATTKQYYVTSQFIPSKCDPIENVQYDPPVAQVSTMASSVIPIGVYQELYFKIIETTPGHQNLPIWDYTVKMSASVDETAAWDAIADKINLNKEDEWFTASSGASSITITAAATTANPTGHTNRTFKLVATLQPTKADPVDYGVAFTATYTTAGKSGSGSFPYVNELYKEALVRQGIGHFYTSELYTPAEMGLPSDLSVLTATSTTFDLYKISGLKTESSKTPAAILTNKFYIFIAVKEAAETAFVLPFGGASGIDD